MPRRLYEHRIVTVLDGRRPKPALGSGVRASAGSERNAWAGARHDATRSSLESSESASQFQICQLVASCRRGVRTHSAHRPRDWRHVASRAVSFGSSRGRFDKQETAHGSGGERGERCAASARPHVCSTIAGRYWRGHDERYRRRERDEAQASGQLDLPSKDGRTIARVVPSYHLQHAHTTCGMHIAYPLQRVTDIGVIDTTQER
jgi:hypothetical protein